LIQKRLRGKNNPQAFFYTYVGECSPMTPRRGYRSGLCNSELTGKTIDNAEAGKTLDIEEDQGDVNVNKESNLANTE
jgi:hypothetical protein